MNKNNWIVLLILCIWFVISFVTNILGPMLPMIIDSFGLSLTLAAFLPFSFFLAYGIMSIPAGMIIERFGGKISLLVAFSLTFLGAGLFVMFPTYPIVLTSLGRFQSDVFGCGAFRHVPDLPYRIDLPFRYRSGHGDATGDYIALDA